MDSINKIEVRKDRDFGQIISIAFEFIRKNFRDLLKYSTVFAGPFFLLGSLVMAAFYYRVNSFTHYAMQTTVDPTATLSLVSLMYIGFFILGIGSLMVILTINEYLVYYMKYPIEELTTTILWNRIKKKFWSYLGGAVVIGIIIMVSFFFLIIPSIYLAISLSFVLIVMSVENAQFGDAFSRSFQVIKNNWWSTFGLLVVIYIIQVLIAYTLMIPLWAVSWIGVTLYPPGQMADFSGFWVIYSTVISVVYYLVLFYLSVISTLVIDFKYFALVEKKEEVGMREKIMNMGKSEEDLENAGILQS